MSISREEQKRNRKIWVDALRSGEYKQGQYTLRQHSRGLAPPYSYKYCCLGVACKVVPGMRDTPDDGGSIGSSLNGQERQLLGISEAQMHHLMRRNDSDKWPFPVIANAIRGMRYHD